MLPMTDSFIEYLKATVPAPPVHWVHVTSDDASNLLTMGRLNVAILNITQDGPMEEALISLDILSTDERQAYTWANDVIASLRDPQYTPEFNYTTGSPVATGKTVHWEADKVRFQVVEAAPLYLHLNCTLPICHVRF